MNRKVTIYDIAKEAGVSGCCVSWVLRNHPRSKGMNADTRKRILDTAAKLGYVQNQLAAATRTGQINTIAVILDFNELQNIMPMNQVMTGIIVEASARQKSIKVFSENDLENSFRSIVENRIGKVIIVSANREIRENSAELAEKYSLDLVYCYERGHHQFPAVNTDNIGMTANAVHYLAERGHTRIGMLCSPHRWHWVEERHAGYLRGMEQCGLQVDPRWISCLDDTEAEVEKMLSLPQKARPTAFITLSDSLAAIAMRTAWRNGLRIPEDLSVIGIGNMSCSLFAMVPITTFKEAFTETGKLLIRLVLGEKVAIRPDEHNVYHTHAEMIERESVYTIDTSLKSQVSRCKSQVSRRKSKV